MRKQFMKRKKLGMALIFTLMVVLVSVAIASSYIGMTASSAKVARAYSKEAIALSLAQSGLDAVLNAMGDKGNWERSNNINRLKHANISLILNRINSSDTLVSADTTTGLQSFSVTNTGASAGSGRPITLNYSAGNQGELIKWFGDNFLTNGLFNDAYGTLYTTNSIQIGYGDVSKVAYLIVGVIPENTKMSNNNIPLSNINYSIGVASLIFDNVPANLNRNQTNLNNLVSSRVVKLRVSSVFRGNYYQNMASADYPNTKHSEQGQFGYPNWAELTADAAFMDENTEMDGGIVLDGPTNGGLGAPKKSVGGSYCNVRGGNATNSVSQLKSSITSNLNNYQNSGLLERGNKNVDTSGILKITTLNNRLMNGGGTSASAIKTILNNATSSGSFDRNEKYFPKFSKDAKASSMQHAVYYDLETGNVAANSDDYTSNPGWLKQVMTKNGTQSGASHKYGTASNAADLHTDVTTSIWKTGGSNYLLTSASPSSTTSGGAYRQMKQSGTEGNLNHSKGYFNYGVNDLKPDPMYANEVMEVPTVKVTISSKDGVDTYSIQRIGYKKSSSKACGWEEYNIGSKTEIKSNESDFDGMIYVAGANVQVKGTASKSVSIVSDLNPEVEYYNTHPKTTGSPFDSGLTSANYLDSDNTYKYIDARMKSDNSGLWEQTPTSALRNGYKSSANQLISTQSIDNNGNISGNTTSRYRYPTYDQDEQPSGNITVIGDLNKADNSNPCVALIAKNRVMLNDFGHTKTNSNATAPKTKDQMPTNASGDSASDGILTVNALIASESHNMCFDFNNVSKNLNYADSAGSTFSNFKSNNGNATYAPGDSTSAVTYTNSTTNYGMLMDQTLGRKLKSGYGDSSTGSQLVSDGSSSTDEKYFFYKYNRLDSNVKNFIWSDTYMGAIRPGSGNLSTNLYSQGALNFHGMVVSRFGDINADAGDRDTATGGRKEQLGYVNQFMNFDTNLIDNAPPYFSLTTQDYCDSSAIIKWNKISYVDKGSL